jgi:hypothetical protein
MSPRIEGCGISEKQLMINAVADAKDITIGAWLDNNASTYTCIAAAR